MGYRGPNVVYPENVHPEGSGDRSPEPPMKQRGPRVPIWKRLVVGLCMGGAVLLNFWATAHWHLAAVLSVGLVIALIVVVWLIVGPALRLPKGWWWRGWALPQPPLTTPLPAPSGDAARPPAPPDRP
jgi:hypothetical protein